VAPLSLMENLLKFTNSFKQKSFKIFEKLPTPPTSQTTPASPTLNLNIEKHLPRASSSTFQIKMKQEANLLILKSHRGTSQSFQNRIKAIEFKGKTKMMKSFYKQHLCGFERFLAKPIKKAFHVGLQTYENENIEVKCQKM
jgi:hypothetical protein